MVTLHVTQQDIDEANAHRSNDESWNGCRLCPVAIATNRLCNTNDLHVNYTECHRWTQSIFLVPTNMAIWISDWDSKEPVEPVSFEVELLV